MREILFRGKRKNSEYIEGSKWIEGNLLKAKFEGEEYIFIFGDKFIFNGENKMKAFSHALVIPETVGEYTGLTDKNGNKIFEGDIVKYECHIHIVAYNDEYAGFWPFYDQDHPAGYGVIGEESEVIGNIHDNPELLEGGTT